MLIWQYIIRNPRGLVADYPVMFQEWIADINKGLNKPQHEEIVRSFVKSFGDAFEVYAITKGYNLDKQFYQDMAWGGLEETDAFKNLLEADRKRISNVIQLELHGTNMNGNPKPQKGKKQVVNTFIMEKYKFIVLVFVCMFFMMEYSFTQTKLIPTNNKGVYTVAFGEGQIKNKQETVDFLIRDGKSVTIKVMFMM